MSGGYEPHPHAYDDLDGIRGFIAEHNLDAADGLIADIRTAIINLVSLPGMGPSSRRPDGATAAFLARARLPHCLCAEQAAPLGDCRSARRAQPPSHGRDSERAGIESPCPTPSPLRFRFSRSAWRR